MQPRQSLADVLEVLISGSNQTLSVNNPRPISSNGGSEPNPYRRRTHGPFHPLPLAVKSDNSRQEALLACFMEGIVFNNQPFWVSMKTQCYFLYSFWLEVGKSRLESESKAF
ncbi:hypothetical protein CDAR_122751 [Caerostris darwini]|uniref:LAGLIDADG homing endonuclease n=1 Tax=Caerostris darwini TaxID=1538125 RepID=A0AAV4UYZ4_9ARAC|nr:hypothetical protein CDAR_122751 [Caerostris darwini]